MSSEILTVSPRLPQEQAVKILNDNDKKLVGKIAEAKFNRLEMNQIFSDMGLQHQYYRDIKLGNILSDYLNWAHVKSEGGYSIWKYPLSDLKDNVENNLYFDDKKLSNRGIATSELASAFDKVFDFDGTAYNDQSTEAASEFGTPFDILRDETDDALYVGHNSSFNGIDFEFESLGIDLALTVEYSKGSGVWASVTGLQDDTNNFSRSGRILFDLPGDFAQETVNGESKYWIRIKTTTLPTISPRLYFIQPLTSVINLLSLNSQQILNEEWAWVYFNNYVYVAIKNAGIPQGEGLTFITSNSSQQNKQNFFVSEHEYKIDYERASFIPNGFTTSQDYAPFTQGTPSLNLNINRGQSVVGPNLYQHSSTVIALTPDDTNYVFIDNTGTITSNVTGFPSGTVPIAQVITTTVITSVVDKRSFINPLLDPFFANQIGEESNRIPIIYANEINAVTYKSGETIAFKDNIWVINEDKVTGTPTEDMGFILKRGASQDAEFIFKETDDRFDFNFPINVQGNIYHSGNLVPASIGSTIGTSTNRYGSLYLNSIIDYVNDLSFRSGGSNRVTIKADGTVGIGTSSPNTNYACHIYSPGLIVDATSGSQGLYVYREGTELFNRIIFDSTTQFSEWGTKSILFRQGGTERFRIHEGGNIGIGISSPTEKLSVAGNILLSSGNIRATNTAAQGGLIRLTANQIAIEQTASGQNSRLFADYSPNHSWGIYHDNVDDVIHLTRKDGSGFETWQESGPGGTTTTTSVTQFHLGSGAMYTHGSFGVGTVSPGEKLTVENGNIMVQGTGGTARVRLSNNGGVAQLESLDAGIDLAFETQAIERMRITSAGKVGIGRTNPSYFLDIQNSDPRIVIRQTASNSGISWLMFGDNSNSDNGVIKVDHATNDMSFGTQGGQIRMTIKNDGKVGIGTNNPSHIVDAKFNSTTKATIKVYNPNSAPTASATLRVDQRNIANTATYTGELRMDSTGVLSIINASGQGIFLDTSQRVGIGTGSPDRNLEINAVGGCDLEVASITSGAATIFVNGYSNSTNISTVSGGGKLQLQNLDGTNNNYSSISFLDNGGQITSAVIGVNENHTTNAGVLTFHYRPSSGNLTEGARLTSSGDFAIYNQKKIIINQGAGGNNYLLSPENDTSRLGIFTAGSERISIAYATGYVGIGTITPQTYLDVNGQISAPGNAAAPAYSFTGELDTGMYLGTTNTIAFSTAGSEKMRVNGSGFVGIGMINPAVMLDIRGTGGIFRAGRSNVATIGESVSWAMMHNWQGTDEIGVLFESIIKDDQVTSRKADLAIRTQNQGISERVRITYDGYVGIGTTLPGTRLTVQTTESDNNGGIRVQRGELPGSYYTELISNYNFTHPFSLRYLGNTGSEMEVLGVYQNIGGGTSRDLALMTHKVGIGVTVPLRKLHIAGDMHIDSTLQPNSPTSGDIYNSGTQLFYHNGSAWIELTASGSGQWSQSGADLYYNTGNVGIGTSSPVTKLQIAPNSNDEGFRMGLGSIGLFGGGYPIYSSNAHSYGTDLNFKNMEPNAAVGVGFLSPMRTETSTARGGIFVKPGNAVAETVHAFSSFNPAITWNTNGFVGIGMENPGSQLEVAGDIANSTTSDKIFTNTLQIVSSSANMKIHYSSADLYFESDTQESMRILRNGNVGIGTSSPNEELHVYRASGSTPTIKVEGAGTLDSIFNLATANRNYYIQCENDTGALKVRNVVAGVDRFVINNDGDIGVNTYPVSLGSSIVTVHIRGKATGRTGGVRGSSSDDSLDWQITGASSGVGGTGNIPIGFGSITNSHIGFFTNNVNRVVIENTGRVGVGTNFPDAQLEVAGGLGFIVDTEDNTYGGYKVDTDSSGDYHVNFRMGRYAPTNNGGFRWFTGARPELGGSWGAGTEKMVLTNAGNIGLGITSPENKIHLPWTARIVCGQPTYLGYSGGATMWGTSNGSDGYPGFFGRNIWSDGTNYYQASSNGSQNWGTSAGILCTGTDPLLRIITIPSSENGLNHNLGTSLNSYTRLAITGSGLVGIGITNPTARISTVLNNNTGITDAIFTYNSGAYPQGGIYTYNSGSYNQDLIFRVHAGVQSNPDTEAMRIISTGFVGIGTSSPSAMLHVNGSIRAGTHPGSDPKAALELASGGSGNYNNPVIALRQVTTEADTRIFADYGSHVGWGIYHRNSDDSVHFTNGSDVGLENWTEPAPGGSTDTVGSVFRIRLGSGDTGIRGSVGIGTFNARQKLEVYTGTGNNGVLINAGAPRFTLETNSSSHYNWRVAAQDIVDKGFEIQSGLADGDATNDTYTVRFSIKADTGFVGIGVAHPDALLHLKGNNARILLEDSSPDDSRNTMIESTAGDFVVQVGDNLATSPTIDGQLKIFDGGTLTYGLNAGETFRIQNDSVIRFHSPTSTGKGRLYSDQVSSAASGSWYNIIPITTSGFGSRLSGIVFAQLSSDGSSQTIVFSYSGKGIWWSASNLTSATGSGSPIAVRQDALGSGYIQIRHTSGATDTLRWTVMIGAMA